MMSALLLTIAVALPGSDILGAYHQAVSAEVPEFRVVSEDSVAILEPLTPENAIMLTPIAEFRQLTAARR